MAMGFYKILWVENMRECSGKTSNKAVENYIALMEPWYLKEIGWVANLLLNELIVVFPFITFIATLLYLNSLS